MWGNQHDKCQHIYGVYDVSSFLKVSDQQRDNNPWNPSVWFCTGDVCGAVARQVKASVSQSVVICGESILFARRYPEYKFTVGKKVHFTSLLPGINNKNEPMTWRNTKSCISKMIFTHSSGQIVLVYITPWCRRYDSISYLSDCSMSPNISCLLRMEIFIGVNMWTRWIWLELVLVEYRSHTWPGDLHKFSK